jgi:hypothetical protein
MIIEMLSKSIEENENNEKLILILKNIKNYIEDNNISIYFGKKNH